MDYTNTGLYRFIYGLYQYMDYINNERVKRVLYTIYQYLKRYHHFNTTIYHTGQEKHYLPISIAPHITISHYHKMKGQRQIISSYFNQHEDKIPPMELYHHTKPLQYNRTLYYKIKESIYFNGKGESIYAVLFAF